MCIICERARLLNSTLLRNSNRDIEDIVANLHHHVNFKLADIDAVSDLADDFRLFIYSQPKLNSQILHAIQQLPCPTKIIDNTIGSFLYDCSLADHGDVDQKCSLNCLYAFLISSGLEFLLTSNIL